MISPRQDKAAGRNYNYSGKFVYIGIDVHKKTYALCVICEGVVIKQDIIPASPQRFVEYVCKRFLGAKIFSAYEAGFCGFFLHRYLNAHGIKNIIVHPAAIEVSARDRVKTDKRDSLKIATQLAAGRLKGIFIPSEEQEKRREITRLRETYAQDKNRCSNRIKSFFNRHQEIVWENKGVMSRCMAQKCLKLEIDPMLKQVLEMLAKEWIYLDDQIKYLNALLKEQALEQKEVHDIVESVPGIGTLGARIILNELGDMKQFSNVRKLYSYTGLTPSEYSSGEKKRQGPITRQGKANIRKILVQAAWITIRYDKSLERKYTEICKRSGAKKAIVAIARILIGKIRACVRDEKRYRSDPDANLVRGITSSV